MILSASELNEERKKRELLEKREVETRRKLELIEFRISVLCRVKEKFNSDLDKSIRDVYKLTPWRKFTISLGYASGELEILKKMKGESEKELKEIEEKIKNCRVDFQGQEKIPA